MSNSDFAFPDIEFKQGDKQHVVEVEVLFDGVREMRETFMLQLKPDENMVAETQVRYVCLFLSSYNNHTFYLHLHELCVCANVERINCCFQVSPLWAFFFSRLC